VPTASHQKYFRSRSDAMSAGRRGNGVFMCENIARIGRSAQPGQNPFWPDSAGFSSLYENL
jgi:hypothetical protein